MKKILILILVLSSFIFAEYDLSKNCCYSSETSAFNSYFNEFDIRGDWNTIAEAIPNFPYNENPQGNTEVCVGHGLKDVYRAINVFQNTFSSDVELERLYNFKREITHSEYDCTCNEESIPMSELPDINDTSKVWETIAYKSCNDSQVQGDIDLWNEANSSNKAMTSGYSACCGSNMTYYLKVDANATCPTNQESDENGVCREKCGTDGLMIDGECLERASCRDGYPELSSVGEVDAFPDCNNNFNEDTNKTFYQDEYNLFPNQEITGDTILTCCVKEWSENADTDGDGITDENDADVDGDGVVDNGTDNNNNGIKDSTENTTDNTSDTNTSTSDNNTTIDSNGTGEIVNAITTNGSKIDKTNSELEKLNSEFSKFANDEVTRHNENKAKFDEVINGLSTVNNSVNSASSKNDQNLKNIKSEIKKSSDLAHEDAENNLNELKKLTDGKEDAENSLSDLKNQLNDAVSNANQNYSSTLDMVGGLLTAYSNTPPTFTGTGEHVFSVNVYNKDIKFDLSMYEELRGYFDILFLLMLAYINFKIYRYIFEFLVKIGV